jgi:hypothetical protein
MLELYEVDKHRQFHLMYRLTDLHMKSTALSAKKVNLAQLGMSHTVVAILNALAVRGMCHFTVYYR